MTKDISIIVAFDNNAPLMENFAYEMIPFIDGRNDREMVLAADGCLNSETMTVARSMADAHPNVLLVELDSKAGYSIANNRTVDASSGEYLLFANTDIFPEGDAIDILRAEFDADPSLGGVQGRLLYPQNGKVMSTGHCFNDYMNHHLYQGRAGDDPVVLKRGERQALNSAFLMMPAKVYAEMGGMDEFFYNAYDGMDLTLRAGISGYRLLYVPEAVAWHSTGGSRDYIRHNNEYQSKYFYSHTGAQVKSDVWDYIAAQLEEGVVAGGLAKEYFHIDCTFCMTWKESLSALGFSCQEGAVIENRDASSIDLYRNLPPAVRGERRPLLFVANHFADIASNKRWFEQRYAEVGVDMCDVVVDFFGNVFEVAKLLG